MNEKLAQALVYVARKLAGDPRNGRTKIHKILFNADFESYRRFGRSITGEDYIKLDRGPFLRAVEPTVRKLAQRNQAEWAPPNERGEIQLIPKADIGVDLLSQEEIGILDATMKRFWGWSADAVSNLSHRLFGWLTTPHGRVIPYNSAYVGDPRPLTGEEDSWALDLIGRYREWKREKAEYCP